MTTSTGKNNREVRDLRHGVLEHIGRASGAADQAHAEWVHAEWVKDTGS
jgi:hypothetical protein